MLDALIESAKGFERTGAWDEALGCYEQALLRLPREGTPAQAAELLRWIGTVHRQRGELELAGEAYEASQAIAEVNGLPNQLAAVLNCMGAVEHQRGNVVQAEELYSLALDQAVRVGDQQLAACLDQNLGALLSLRGELARALESYESALTRSRALDNGAALETRALINMGTTHLRLGELDAAEDCLQRAFELAESAGEMLMVGTLELNRAGLYLQQQRFDQARESCDRSLDVFCRLRSKYWTAEAYKFQGILHRETGHAEEADACLAMAVGLAEVAQNRLLQAEAQMEWATIHLQAGRHPLGIMYLNRALRLFTEMQARREVLDIQERLDKMETLYLHAVRQWSTALFAVSCPEQAEHAERVATLSCLLAEELGLSGWDLTVVRVGALIHDIGYTAIPASALPRPELGSAGHPLLKAHTVAGDAIAASLDFPAEVRSIVRHHHERVAGTGYPDRLAGAGVPLATQIVAIVDAFDRMVHPLEARPACSPQQALHWLAVESRAEFDPDLVAAICRVAGYRLEANAA